MASQQEKLDQAILENFKLSGLVMAMVQILEDRGIVRMDDIAKRANLINEERAKGLDTNSVMRNARLKDSLIIPANGFLKMDGKGP